VGGNKEQNDFFGKLSQQADPYHTGENFTPSISTSGSIMKSFVYKVASSKIATTKLILLPIGTIWLGSQADVNRLTARAVSGPTGGAIHFVLGQHNRPSAVANLFHKYCFLVGDSRHLDIIIFQFDLPAISLYNR
jgi:hypothetical protein